MKSTDNITLNKLLTIVARQEASDLHLTIGAPPVIRKDGHLIQLADEEIITVNFLGRILDAILSDDDRKQLELKNELIITKTFNKILRYRVHVYQQKSHYSLAFRYIPLRSGKLSDAGLPSYLEKAARFKHGMIIIAGIYDSGRSTTLAAILNTLNELGPPRYINTLESPVEYLFANNKCIIEQREIGKDVVSYAQGLNMVLQEDIDMVAMDRLSDQRAAKKMLEVLEAGRSVILVVNASSAINGLNRIFSFFDQRDAAWARQVVGAHLLCVLTQKLIFKIGGGRILVYEFLANAGLVPSFINSGNLERISSLLRNAAEFDMISIEKSLAALVKKGEVKLEDALIEANDKDYLKSLVR